MVSTLVLIYFGRLRQGHRIKTNFIRFLIVDPKICSISIFFIKGSWSSLSTIFGAWFFGKIFLTLYSIYWPSLIVWLSLLPEINRNHCLVNIYRTKRAYNMCLKGLLLKQIEKENFFVRWESDFKCQKVMIINTNWWPIQDWYWLPFLCYWLLI